MREDTPVVTIYRGMPPGCPGERILRPEQDGFDSIMDFRLKLAEKVIPAEAVTFNGMTSSRVTFNLNDAVNGHCVEPRDG